MDNFTSSVGKIKIDTFSNSSLNSAQNVFKKDFYSKANKQNINDYEDIDYSIDIDLQEQVELHKDDKSFWETVGDVLVTTGATAVTFVTSVATGIVDVGETIVDGAVQIVGGVASYAVQGTGTLVSLFDEEAGQSIKDASEVMKDGIQSFVSYDFSGNLYDKAVTAMGIDEEIAYGFAHTAGNLVGSVAGYAAITVVTGGAGTVMLSAAAAGGAAAENAYAKGASFDEAMIASSTSAVLGAVSGGAMDKLGVAAKGVTSLKGAAGITLAGAGIGGGEAFANSLVEYATFGNDNYDSFGDYYTKTGGVLNTVIGAGAGGLSMGTQSLNSYIKSKKYLSKEMLSPSAISQTNHVQNYKFDRNGYINHVNDLLNQGYNDNQILDILAEYGNRCSEINNKLAFSDFSYEYLISRGYDPQDAAVMMQNAYDNLLSKRGMTTVYVDDNGIKYNMINDFNQGNQAYDMNYINQQIRELPQNVRDSIKEINIYDTFNPADYYWNNNYNSTGGYFRSAATGGNGTINLWANDFVDSSTISHEAGHCFDINRQFSESQDYLKAIYNDKLYNGLESVTEYGKNNSCEDFAESLAAYFGKKNGVNIDQFPNRKAYFDRIFKTSNSILTSESVNNLNKVTNILSNKYGSHNVTKIFYEYLTTGDINKITRTDGAREIISKMDINEVLEYYNIINGG